MTKILQNCAIVVIATMMITIYLPMGSSSDDLIESTCKNTPNYQLCDFILRSDPKGGTAADLKGLSLIMVNSLKSKSNATMQIINQILKERPEKSVPLTNCLDKYIYILNFAICDAIEAATKGDPDLGEESMYGVTMFAHECEDGFKPSPSPLTNLNQIICDVAAVASAMFTMMRIL